jgi:hypothetical protein
MLSCASSFQFLTMYGIGKTLLPLIAILGPIVNAPPLPFALLADGE